MPVTIGPAQFPLPTLAPPPPQPGNSIQFTYGPTIFDTNNTPKTIDLLFTLTVNAKPFADGLHLTNETQECEKNTFGITFCQTAIAPVQVREPKLSIRKGVIATDNPHGKFTQPTTPASTQAQAPSGATFSLAGVSGLITSSQGPSPLGGLFDSDLTNVDANDLATFAIVIENQGGHPAFNVRLTDLVPWDKSTALPTCFELIASSLSIKDGSGLPVPAITGTAVNSSGSVSNLGISLTNPIPALDNITGNSGANIIVITFQVKFLANTKAGCCDNSVKLTQYTSISDPNAPNFVAAGIGGQLEDTARVCVGPWAYAKCIQTTSELHTVPQQATQGGQVPAAIGEIVRFRMITVIPEGTTQDFQIQDLLPSGLTYVGNPSAIFVANGAANIAITGHPPIPIVPGNETTVRHAYPHSSGAIVRYPWLNKELGHEASDAGRSVA